MLWMTTKIYISHHSFKRYVPLYHLSLEITVSQFQFSQRYLLLSSHKRLKTSKNPNHPPNASSKAKSSHLHSHLESLAPWVRNTSMLVFTHLFASRTCAPTFTHNCNCITTTITAHLCLHLTVRRRHCTAHWKKIECALNRVHWNLIPMWPMIMSFQCKFNCLHLNRSIERILNAHWMGCIEI